MPSKVKKRVPSVGPDRALWSVEDKERLLKIFEKHGSGNTKLIHRLMKNKSEAEVDRFITAQRLKARKHYYIADGNEKTSLDKWIELCYDRIDEFDSSPCLGKAFMIAAITEDHPRPEEVNGVDYQLIYKFLSDVMQGRVARQLPPPTAKKLLEILKKLADIMKRSKTSEEKKYLTSSAILINKAAKKLRKDAGNENGEDSDEVDSLGSKPPNVDKDDYNENVSIDNLAQAINDSGALNPLRIPSHLLQPKPTHMFCHHPEYSVP